MSWYLSRSFLDSRVLVDAVASLLECIFGLSDLRHVLMRIYCRSVCHRLLLKLRLWKLLVRALWFSWLADRVLLVDSSEAEHVVIGGRGVQGEKNAVEMIQ